MSSSFTKTLLMTACGWDLPFAMRTLLREMAVKSQRLKLKSILFLSMLRRKVCS